MALVSGVNVQLTVIGDGTSTVFAFDLLKDPYITGSGVVQNWFASDRKATSPTGVIVTGGLNGGSATLSGTLVTLTYGVPLAANAIQNASIYLLFPSE